MIAQWQIDQFHQQGFLVVEEVLSSADIAALQSDFDGWVEESRGHATVWGETLDGRASISSAIMLLTIRRCAGSPPRRRSPRPIAILR